ncbi:MAG: C-terminal processing peptidase-1, partial [Halothiobacillaceae bacterium]
MLKRCITLFTLLSGTLFLPAITLAVSPLLPSSEQSFSSVLITKFIAQYHYKKNSLDDTQSQQILDHYIKLLDPNRGLFTQEDIDSFQRYRTQLDEALLKGDLQPAFTIFQRYHQRRLEWADYALQRLEKPFDFSIDEEYIFDRQDLPWLKNRAELDNLWDKRVKNDVLSLQLANKSDAELKKTLHKRYERAKVQLAQFKSEDIYSLFMNAYLATLEPHSNYLSPRGSENFKINMSLSLEGIGAVLRTIDEHTVVQSVVAGGPAALSKQLHPDDRIIGVGQGRDKEMVDVIGWRLEDVVELIRGPKDTVVRLQILSKQSGLDGPSKTITLVRNKINLEEQQAKKSIIELSEGSLTR